ncbi:coiled-coil domain-containing protein [Salipaludibacillus sp. HK11]|uniref:coiled-coil domain-containing protein n=1 Tax=Salipaludibacillus sp. HK11 TaxID=3394320 RepID=UPI0039FBBF0D
MKRNFMGLIVVVGISSLLVLPSTVAQATSELEDIQSERSDVQSNLSEAEQELSDILTEIEELNEQIDRIDQGIADNQEKMDETEEDISMREQEIEILEEEIVELEADIEKRFNLLKDRANAYQKQGGNSRYLEVILGSEGFSDFVTRVFTISKIAQADTDFIDTLEKNQLELEEKQDAVQTKLDDLNDVYTEMEGMLHHLEDQKEQNDEAKEELQAKESQTEDMMAELIEEDENLQSQEAAIQERIEAERQRQEEARQAAEQTSNQDNNNTDAVASNNNNNNNSNSNSTNSTSSASSAPAPSSGGSSVTTVGRKYIGNSTYVFGGGRSAYDVANGRFDCSGFVGWAFSQVGKSVPYSTDGLVNMGQRISYSNAQAGDLVFFNTYKTNGHVGIYLGGGQFIGSQSSTGVAVANMNSGYWADNFHGVVVRP